MIIVKVATMYSNGVIVEGQSYCDVHQLANKMGLPLDKLDGFMTSSGNFVLPDEAATIALEAGQIDKVDGTLTPEDLWPSVGV